MGKSILVLPDGGEISSGAGSGWAIESVRLTQSVNEGQQLFLGSACAGMLEVKLLSGQNPLDIQAGQELTLYQENDQGLRRKIGLFTMEKPEIATANTRKWTGYDRVSWLDRDLSIWLGELDMWPYPLYQFAKSVCQACGLTLQNSSIPNGDFMVQKFKAGGITGRKLMQWVAEACGRFCRATVDGQIELAWYADTDVRIAPSGDRFYYQNSLSYGDFQTEAIEKVQIRRTEEEVGVVWPNSGTHAYILTGNGLLTAEEPEALQKVAQELYSQLKDVRYTPCKVTVQSSLDVQPGQIVTITTPNGNTISSYIMQRSRSGQKDTLECMGTARRDSTSAVNEQSYRALSGKILNLRTDVEGIKAENADTEGRVASLEMHVEGIITNVSNQQTEMETLKTQQTTLSQTAQELAISVQTIREDGVSRVETETGYTFGENGLRICKSGEEMENLLDNTGMYVTRSGETILQANAGGVVAADVTVRNYLNVGEHARLEDYTNGTDSARTACYYLG